MFASNAKEISLFYLGSDQRVFESLGHNACCHFKAVLDTDNAVPMVELRRICRFNDQVMSSLSISMRNLRSIPVARDQGSLDAALFMNSGSLDSVCQRLEL
jgi:hypothetical protein